MLPRSQKNSRLFVFVAALFMILIAAIDSAAQSSDPGYPAPVFSNEVAARIIPRDLGDPRRTRHYYTFRGTEGDLLVTLEGSGLIGAVDVFTVTTQRPLLNITLLGEATRVTKSFYIRKEETLILRVEARAVGDAEGSYRITFGGSFAPAPTDLASAPPPLAATASGEERRGKTTRRVTSTGARIEEPVAATPTREETKDAAVAEAVAPEKPTTRKESSTTRGARGTRASSAKARNPKAKTEKATIDTIPKSGEPKPDTDASQPIEAKADEANKTSDAATPAASTSKRPATRRKGARTSSSRGARSESTANAEPSAAQPAAQPAPSAPSQRLVIVTKDGETLERDMNTVRRVTVENNQLVVVSKDGKVTRQPMANVLKMSIEP